MIIYQVLPRLWGNGKFSDWQTPSFEYLKSLGVDAVWYTGLIRHSMGEPFVKGNAGSPYSIADCHDVNPYLADNPRRRMQEFKALVSRTHKAGLKVIADYVPNHVGALCKDVPTFDWYDYDWEDTRKIDYSAPGTWEAMLEIALYWAGMGIDGLRCDMVELVPPEFLKWLISKVKARYPHFIFIGEAYELGNYRRYIRDLGFDLLYDKSGFYDSVRAILGGRESARALTRNWQRLSDLQPNMLNFLENHDEQRLASPWFASAPERGYAALAFAALYNEASFMLYAGQELGEDAAEGAEGRTSIFDFVKVRTLSDLWAKLSGRKARLPQKENRILARYRDILGHVEAMHGFQVWDLCYCNADSPGFNPDRHFAFLRYSADEAWLVFCNFSHERAVAEIFLPEEVKQKCHPVAMQDGNLKVAAEAFDASIIRFRR